ncbi:DUF3015 family protein [Treponema sp.]|uniref:DUF3015 family protein n=1 Tax=Treponema sp. TaxID=166 RepID=UPI003F00FA3F
MKKIAAVVFAAAMALSTSAFATKVGPGLGYVIFGQKNGPMYDLIAATTNGTFCSQFFAITFGTSGYSGGFIGMEETDKFIADNMDALAADIAMGEGEYIDTLSAMLNVSDSAAFKSALQANFDNIFSSSEVSAEEVSSKIYSLVG